MDKKEVCGIYGYYDNLKDRIVYVGQSYHIYQRHGQHFRKGHYDRQPVNRVLQNNPLRYDLVILKECSVDELNHWEITLIALFNPKFNFNIGGGSNKGYKHTDEAKRKLSKAGMGRTASPETREKLRKASTGRKLSPETRRKLSESHKGEKSHNYGKHLSAETRRKISESHKKRWKHHRHHNYGKPRDPETIEKVRRANIGKKLSEKTKQKLREAHLKKYPTLTKGGIRHGKQVWVIRCNGKRVTQSYDKSRLEHIINEHWDELVDGSFKYVPPLMPPRIKKCGVRRGKQQYCVYFNKKHVTVSVYKEKVEKYLEEHYDEIIQEYS